MAGLARARVWEKLPRSRVLFQQFSAQRLNRWNGDAAVSTKDCLIDPQPFFERR